jgi:hypothetical protein
MSQESFEQFRQLVLQDQSLQAQLRATPDLRSFFDLAARLGAARGCQFSVEDAEAAMRASRQAWLQHQMVS